MIPQISLQYLYLLHNLSFMLSRVADSIYWLNRYIERAENVARFIDVNLNLMLDLSAGMLQQWHPLVSVTGDMELFSDRYKEANSENVIQFLTFDEAYPHSIISCLKIAQDIVAATEGNTLDFLFTFEIGNEKSIENEGLGTNISYLL